MATVLSRRLSCFYCGQRSGRIQNSQKTVRKWRCEHCEAVNHLDEVTPISPLMYIIGLAILTLRIAWKYHRSPCCRDRIRHGRHRNLETRRSLRYGRPILSDLCPKSTALYKRAGIVAASFGRPSLQRIRTRIPQISPEPRGAVSTGVRQLRASRPSTHQPDCVRGKIGPYQAHDGSE